MFWTWFIFTIVVGACVGSFLNVVILRMPEGRSVVHPPSHDPASGRRLAWYENIPVLSWLFLRGRDKVTRAPISVQYPVVEAATAALFGLTFWAYYATDLRAEFAFVGLENTWLVLVVHLLLLACLVAATVIDARLFIIPLPIPWFATVAALIGLPLAAAYHQIRSPGGSLLPMASPTETGMAVGALAGLVLSLVLLWRGALPRSFADWPDPESDAPPSGEAPVAPAGGAVVGPPRFAGPASAVALAVAVAVGVYGAAAGSPVAVGIAAVLIWPVLLLVAMAGEGTLGSDDVAAEMFAYPNPRREVLKEVLFLAPAGVGAVLGGWLLPGVVPAGAVAAAVGGALIGYLVGGLLVWGTRILGTLGFGKEAMGLGDVHLVGAIGAVVGPLDATLLFFFIAPVMGIMSALVSVSIAAVGKGQVRVIPYGPSLAAAAVVVMLFREPLHGLLPLAELVDTVRAGFEAGAP